MATLHRAENTDDPESLTAVVNYMREASLEAQVVIPLHPRTQAACERFGVSLAGLTVIEPLGYLDMTLLVASSRGVLTDSGGLQKEAYFHGVPCVTLRAETEWIETVECGWNRLWQGPPHTEQRTIEDYGTGNAATVIVDRLYDHF